MKPTIIISASDNAFGALLLDAVTSIRHQKACKDVDIGIFDLGLDEAQRKRLAAYGARLIRPEWPAEMQHYKGHDRQLGLVARQYMRDYFPGFRAYLWFDADAWVQDDSFIAAYVAGALREGLAVAREADPCYRFEPYAWKWAVGNALLGFGAWDGIRLCLGTPINGGLIALRDDAPHWDVWRRRYLACVYRTGKLNLDQHALAASLRVDGLAAAILDEQYNWIGTRAPPMLNEATGLFCKPYPPYEHISVMHLAGPNKHSLFRVRGLHTKPRLMRLTFSG